MDVQVPRCLCIHALGQSVDCILQQLLFHRQFVPLPVTSYMNTQPIPSDIHKHKTFCSQFDQIRQSIVGAFKTANASRIRDVVIVIGGNFVSMRELFAINLPPCKDNKEDDLECGGGLSDKEHRLLSRIIFTNQDIWDSAPKLPPRSKQMHVLLSIVGEESIEMPGFRALMSEVFSIPTEEVAKGRKIFMSNINVLHDCRPTPVAPKKTELRWFACETVINGVMM